MKFLIAKGSDINSQTVDGYSALIFASYYGHADLVKIFAQMKKIKYDQQEWDNFWSTNKWKKYNNNKMNGLFKDSNSRLTHLKRKIARD